MEERGKAGFQVQEEDKKREDSVVTFDRVEDETVVGDTASEEKKTGILAKFGGFWRKSKKNKIAVILGGVLILALIGGAFTSEKEERYSHPNKEKETSEETTSEETTSTESSSGGTVSADFKATMDSYEKFMNSYVDFMKKYEKSSDVSSMMNDYAEFTGKYADFAKKIEAIDEKSLSSADYAYYVEVNARVTKKLAELTS